MSEDKQYTPDPMVGWKNKSEKTGTVYLTVVAKEDIKAGTRLRLFAVKGPKKNPKSPDYFGKFEQDKAEEVATEEAASPF